MTLKREKKRIYGAIFCQGKRHADSIAINYGIKPLGPGHYRVDDWASTANIKSHE